MLFLLKALSIMRVHFIAIGGSAMHNLALALHEKGYQVTGSDDQIFEPSRTRLSKAGILPEQMGWFPNKINSDIDAVILGMHARKDNPELLKAQELGLSIYSYPEYLFNQSEEKIRVVIAGSHGKTTITSMVMHVLKYFNRDFDYMVGAQLENFDTMVRITDKAPIMILEGDEYLSSPIDPSPKFLWYKPHVALISGIAWDHINVFPTFEEYVDQFEQFINSMRADGVLVYCEVDSEVKKLVENNKHQLKKIAYRTPAHKIVDGVSFLTTDTGEVPLHVFGQHNLQNLNGARLVLNQLNISDEQFYEAIQSFGGAARRLELIAKNEKSVVYKDFAHSPSKLKATTSAVKTQFPDKELYAVMELHTFSSLNAEFLATYQGSMNAADKAIVYFNPETIAHKKLDPITVEQVKEAFGREDLMVRTNSEQLQNYLKGIDWDDKVLLLMSSGNFDGINLNEFGAGLISPNQSV